MNGNEAIQAVGFIAILLWVGFVSFVSIASIFWMSDVYTKDEALELFQVKEEEDAD